MEMSPPLAFLRNTLVGGAEVKKIGQLQLYNGTYLVAATYNPGYNVIQSWH